MKILASENGTIDDRGKLKVYNKQHFFDRVGTYRETNIEILIVERSSGFTDQMRKYYFTVVVPEIRNAYRAFGHEKTLKEVDAELRDMALFYEFWDDDKKIWVRIPHRLSNDESEVTYSQFKDYLEWCIRYAAQTLEWSIAFPNEVLQREDLTDRQINHFVTSK